MGVFVPRPLHLINGEIDVVRRMTERLDKKDLTEDEIKKYIQSDKCREDKHRREFLSKIYHVYEGNKVIFNKFYLNEKLGGISLEKLQNENFFNMVELIHQARFSDVLYKLCFEAGLHVR